MIILLLIIAIAFLPVAIRVFCTATINVCTVAPDIKRAVANNLLGTPRATAISSPPKGLPRLWPDLFYKK